MSELNLLASSSTGLFGPALAGLDSELGDSPDNWLVDVAPQADASSLSEALPSTRNEPHTVEAPPGAATVGGSLGQALDFAHGWLGSLYDWGGSGYDGRGVDCSGLLYNAFKRAGYNVQRWRAKDYGHMGVEVSADAAQPGDVVYFDNPGDTDHVGIYLGDGQFIESPTQGQRVQVSHLRGGAHIRRIFTNDAHADLMTEPDRTLTYHAPDGQQYRGSVSAQRDPLEVLNGLDQSVEETLAQDEDFLQLGNTPNDVVLPGEESPTSAPQTGTTPDGGGGSLGRVLNALSGQESGGDYNVVNSIGAIGKYQVMTANVGTWSRQVLGYSVSPAQFRASPDIQERVVRGIFGGYVEKYGLRGALATWYSGKPGRHSDYTKLGNGSGPSVGDYVDQVLARMR